MAKCAASAWALSGNARTESKAFMIKSASFVNGKIANWLRIAVRFEIFPGIPETGFPDDFG